MSNSPMVFLSDVDPETAMEVFLMIEKVMQKVMSARSLKVDSLPRLHLVDRLPENLVDGM